MKNGFLIIGFLFGIAGVLQLTNVTLGTGLICFGCLLAIVARIRQQETHHEEIIRLMGYQGADK